MSYQKIDLVYGVTLNEKEYKKVRKLINKISTDDDEDDEDEILENFGIVVYNGYYNDTYKVGFSIEEDEVRTMQDFVFDFSIPNTSMLNKIITKNTNIIEQIGLDVSKFSLSVCTYNY